MPLKTPDFHISPTYKSEKFDAPTIDDLIDVYEDRILGWVLKPAKEIAAKEDGGPAALCLLLTYFEGAWSYKVCESSTGRSREFFVKGFVDVFSSPHNNAGVLTQLGEILYRDARCGFFHEGLFRDRIYIASMNTDIAITLPRVNGAIDVGGKIQSAVIDVSRCATGVEKHFTKTIGHLRESANATAREAFRKFFKDRCDWSIPGPIVALT